MKKFWIALIIIIVLLAVGYLLLGNPYGLQQQHTSPQSTTEKTVVKPEPSLSQEAQWCKTLKDPQARARACKMAQQRRAINHR